MKLYVRTLFPVVALAFILSIASSAFGQQRPVLGGYKVISSEDASAAADFAVETQGEKTDNEIELVSIEKAEKQTVGGSNFRLLLKVTGVGGKDAETCALVVVFLNPKQEFSLTSWAAKACPE